MKNTAGQEIEENIPILGCLTCKTTSGRMGCPIHANPMTPPPQDWEKEFDKWADKTSRDNKGDYLTHRQIKEHIRSQRAEAQQEIIKRLEKELLGLFPAFPNKKMLDSLTLWNQFFMEAKRKVLELAHH